MELDLTIQWINGSLPEAGLTITQVYGFCFDPRGDVLLIEDQGQYSLPGGKPENRETFEETLLREAMEEAQVELVEIYYLGYQLVENDRTMFSGLPYVQVRMVAKINRMFPPSVDPARGRVNNRIICPASRAAELLAWGKRGEEQMIAASRLSSTI